MRGLRPYEKQCLLTGTVDFLFRCNSCLEVQYFCFQVQSVASLVPKNSGIFAVSPFHAGRVVPVSKPELHFKIKNCT